MKKLRIAHIDTERTWRGGEQQVLSLMEGLRRRGHENLLIARRGSAIAEKARGKFALQEVRPLGEWDFIAPHFVNRRLKKDGIQIVHAHTAHGVSLAAIATLGTSIPFLITRRVDFHLSQNPFSRWKYRRAARIVAISQGVKRILSEDGIPKEKLTVVSSGVDFERYLSVKKMTKPELGFPADCVLIGQAAALAPHKDQRTFLKAIALLHKENPAVRAIIIGEGPCRAELEKLRKELDLDGIVLMPGFRDNPLDIIAAFDIFCLSSKEEGLGTSLIDAMALKIPVVATRTGGIPELIDDRQTGYLASPEDAAGLAQALKTALASAKNSQQLLINAFERAKKFNISFTVEQMEAIYSELSTGLST